jgi:hypothetical protein
LACFLSLFSPVASFSCIGLGADIRRYAKELSTSITEEFLPLHQTPRDRIIILAVRLGPVKHW